jgi:hypothetical protein
LRWYIVGVDGRTRSAAIQTVVVANIIEGRQSSRLGFVGPTKSVISSAAAADVDWLRVLD